MSRNEFLTFVLTLAGVALALLMLLPGCAVPLPREVMQIQLRVLPFGPPAEAAKTDETGAPKPQPAPQE